MGTRSAMGTTARHGDITPTKVSAMWKGQPQGHMPHQGSSMGTYPPLKDQAWGHTPPSKVSHGDITPTEGQVWGHTPHQRSWGQRSAIWTYPPPTVKYVDITHTEGQGAPTIHLGGEPNS